MNFEFLSTSRLSLRKLTPEAYTFIFENYPEDRIRKELGITSDAEYAKELEKYKGGYTMYNRSLVNFQLIDKQSNEVIGVCGFHNWFKEHSRAEIGYGFTREEFKKKGLMSEAMVPVLHYGFNQMQLNRVEACIGPSNAASLQLIKKYNFRQEGYLHQHYFRDDVWHDSLIFALLKDEYKIFESKKI